MKTTLSKNRPETFAPLARSRQPRLAVLLAVGGLLGAVGHSHGGTTSLRMDSQPGDDIGGGQQYFFTPSDGTFGASQSASNSVSISFHTPGFEHWFYLDFAAPSGQRLSVGTYLGATRFPFQLPSEPGLSVSGDGRGCNTLTGNFEIKQAVFGSGNTVTKFWATFEQHCEGGTPALLGDIRINADVPVVLSAPVSITNAAGQSLSFTVTAVEILNRPVILSATNLPSGASFTDNGNNTGTFLWTPALSQGGTYLVGFHADNNLGGTDNFATRIAITPPNDQFTNATVIAALPFADHENTSAATTSADDPSSCTYPAQTVWYSLTLDRNARILATMAGSDYEPVLSIFSGAALTQVGCSFGSASQFKFDAVAGQTYYFMVGAYFSEASNLVFSVSEILPPPNDDFAQAAPLTAPSTNSVDTELATTAPDDPADCGSPAATVWYWLAPTEDSFIELDVLESDNYVFAAAYTGARGALHQVACSSGGIHFAALAGQTYYVMLSSANGGSPNGNVTFALRRFPLLKIAVTIDSSGSVDPRTGLATIRGTVTNSQPALIFLSGSVRQKVGRLHVITAEFGGPSQFIAVPSDGQASWSVQVLGDSGSFGGGAALVSVFAGTYDPVSNQSAGAEASATIQLRGSNH